MGPKTGIKSRGKGGCGVLEAFIVLFVFVIFIMNYSWIKTAISGVSIFVGENSQGFADGLASVDTKKIQEYENLLKEAKHLSSTLSEAHQDKPVIIKESLPAVAAAAVSNSLASTDSSSSNLRGVKSDLIIGMAQNTDPKNLAVFCKSIREVNKDTEVILFINAPIPALHTKIANDNRIILKGYYSLVFSTHSLTHSLTNQN